MIKVSGTVNPKKIGTYNLVYSVSDRSGNTTKVTRKITVFDNIKPSISGAKNKTIRYKSHFNPKTGVTARDNVDGNITIKIKISGKVNTRKRGVYKLYYSVSDRSGNKVVVLRKIVVK